MRIAPNVHPVWMERVWLWSLALALGCTLGLSTSATAAESTGTTPEASPFQACTQPVLPDKVACLEAALSRLIDTVGTETSLTELERLANVDRDVLAESHPLVHHIGKRTFARYKTAAEALSHCTAQFWSGCYHGVLQAYLSSLPQVQPQHILSLCPVTEAVPVYSFPRYNCLHGVGHGITMQFRYDVLKSLAFCDAFPGPWERESCYGGVFMENIVAFQEARRAPAGHQHGEGDEHGGGHHGAGPPPTPFLNPDDLLYPCSVLHDKYLSACYLMQTSSILTFTGYDFSRAFPVCAKVPTAFQVTCARSLGRDISGFTMRQPDRVRELCALGNGSQVVECLIGATKDFMLTDASPEPGLALCRTVTADQKSACYATVGEILLTLLPDRPGRETVCRRAEADYIEACLVSVREF
ncbi:MAG: hypothetical protein U0172_02265 [Nitrospiraceae bacterium]